MGVEEAHLYQPGSPGPAVPGTGPSARPPGHKPAAVLSETGTDWGAPLLLPKGEMGVDWGRAIVSTWGSPSGPPSAPSTPCPAFLGCRPGQPHAHRPPPGCGGGRRDLWPSTAFSVLTGPLTTFPGPVAEDEEGQAGLGPSFWGQEEAREAWIKPEGTLGLLSRLGCWAALCQVVSMTRWQVPHHCPPPLAASFRSSHRLLGPLESPAPSQDSEDS